ncbi:response regulator [Mucilaginibacter sp. OK098]|uniref:response regulator n=1 Tax=Mucilaginibacter sp. OK098 TaxID=1855297 RepID=UPI0009185859|nr:response regulator [Mucilaginibacter sp. OK098]SHM96645.1 Signal transduction histidine kinase [Mucilaginibacter sp. OK098]
MLRFSFRQQVFAGFAVSVILVLAVGILSYKSISQLENDSNRVEHTQKVIKASTNLLQLMIDAETGMRGFVATNKPAFLDPYNAALPNIKGDIEQLREQIADNPLQVRRIDSLATLVSAQLNILKTNIEVRQVQGLDYMVNNNMLVNGKQNMDEIRSLIDHMKNTENNLLTVRKSSSQAASSKAIDTIVIGSIVFLVIIVVLFIYIQGTFERQKKIEQEIKVANSELEVVLDENKAKNWLLTGTGSINERMQGQQSERELAGNVLTEICNYTKALTGTFYLFNEEEQILELYASYAFNSPDALKKTVKVSEGWLGQVAHDEKAAVVKGKLNDKLELGSSLIHQEIIESFIVPFFFDKKLKGVIEIAFANELDKNSSNYILAVANDIGIAVNTAQARTILHELLLQVQQQAEELEAQQEEMRVTNEELLSKTEMLQASEEEMRVQQEELRTTNAELEEKASLLEEKNQAIEEARRAINIKVGELETTGKYKSEFLANMSHELRTPLNSILVLARILKDNKPANLSEDQIKYASVIFNAGNDLLTLINDILDLSKIESGKLDMQNDNVKVADILHDMEMLFAEVARNKKINYTITTSKHLPKSIFTDKVRVEQVLKNLLSNAFKFTPESGSIAVNVVPGDEEKTISFCIKDSGIGIPHDKQKIIFEAFQQADGSTSRRFGGTGLGLSISRELVTLLGGKITVTSEHGGGSEFILTIPLKALAVTQPDEITSPTVETFAPEMQFLKPARPVVKVTDKEPLVVIVEDDKNFADILHDYSRDHGYKSIMVYEGTNAVEVIKENQPDAVILDIMLPGKDGWQILKELKQDEQTMHIPVHLMSAGEAAANRVRREGAISFLKKPIDTGTLDKLFIDIMQQNGTKFTQILLVEDNKTQSQALNDMMQSQGITVDQAFDGESAFRMLHEKEYQCVILDLNLPDISGLDFLDKIKEIDRFKALPVIINTAMELDKASVSRLMHYANAMVVKTTKSADRLIDEVNLFLNKVRELADQSADIVSIPKNKMITQGKDVIKGKKVLIVDDDMRNIFALSSALQSYDMIVEIASDGQEAIDKLEVIKDIDLVLMDIMMPVMDGYEATRYIRKQNKWAKLPVIALTAKAMMDDREKCIAAGANDYITKPVDMDRLVSLMQLWLGS